LAVSPFFVSVASAVRKICVSPPSKVFLADLEILILKPRMAYMSFLYFIGLFLSMIVSVTL